jgi:hypothetical protein
MKLSKNFNWDTFQRAAKNRQSSFITDGWMYDIIYIWPDGYMIDNKRRPNPSDITTEEYKDIANMADGTPLIINKDGEYKPLSKRGNK